MALGNWDLTWRGQIDQSDVILLQLVDSTTTWVHMVKDGEALVFLLVWGYNSLVYVGRNF